MDTQYIVALEISSSKIVGTLAKRVDDEPLQVLAVEKEALRDCMKNGCVMNVEEVANKVKKVITALESYQQGYKVSKVYVNVAGRSIKNVPVTVEHNLDGDENITEAHINSLLSDARSKTVDGEVLNVIPSGYMIDGVSTNQPVGMYGTNIKAKVQLIIARPVLKKNLSRCIEERLNFKIAEYVTEALSSADVVLTKEDKTLGCMLVDFGAETTTVTIYQDEKLMYLATIPLGSYNITRDVTSLKLMIEDAENLKIKLGSAVHTDDDSNLNIKSDMTDDIDYNLLSRVIESRTGEIVENIMAQFQYSGIKESQLAAGIVVIGGGSKLKGFIELMENRSGVKVRKGCLCVNVSLQDCKNVQPFDVLELMGIAVKGKENCLEEIQETPAEEVHEEKEAPVLHPDFTVKPVEEEKEEKKKSKEHEKKSSKPKSPSVFSSMINKLKDKTNQMFSDDDNDDGFEDRL